MLQEYSNGGMFMLFALSVRICRGKNSRRLDLIVEAADPDEAAVKALKQAKKIYYPGKKAVYTVIKTVSETEALEVFHPKTLKTES
jgi:hypothetical protein